MNSLFDLEQPCGDMSSIAGKRPLDISRHLEDTERAASFVSEQANELYVCLWPECKVSTAQLSELNKHYAVSHLSILPSTYLRPFPNCDYREAGIIGPHIELKEHIHREHPVQRAWMVIDKSLDWIIASTCNECSSNKLYSTADEAITHLRENHIESPMKKRKRSNQDRNADALIVWDNVEDWVTEISINGNIKGEVEALPNNLQRREPSRSFLKGDKSALELKPGEWLEDSELGIKSACDASEDSRVIPDPQRAVSSPRSWIPRAMSSYSSMPRNVTPSSEDSFLQGFTVKDKRQCLITPDDTDTDSIQALDPESPAQIITFLENDEMESNKLAFLALPVGHPMLKKWVEILPCVRSTIKEILGKGNKGSVDFCSFRGEPTLCITCRRPNRVKLGLLKTSLATWGLPALIAKSSNKRSAWPGEYDDPRRTWSVPAVSARFNRRVHCGSSLGTSLSPFQNHKVSLGGYLKLLHQDKDYWTLYAVTVHHAIEPPEKEWAGESMTSDSDDSQASTYGSDASDEDETSDFGERGSVPSQLCQNNTARVVNGTLEGVQGDINFCSPAGPDFEHAMQRKEHLQYLCRLRPGLARMFNYGIFLEKSPISEGDTAFGKAIWSSGLCKDNGSEMDWLLIGELRTSRVGCNSISERPGFTEGNATTRNGQGLNEPLPTEYVDQVAFESLMAAVEDSQFFQNNAEYRFHIKGHGSESGLKDGFLNPAVGVGYDGEDSSYRYSFHPRERPGLGQSGDSGTWIFLENGVLLGQIHSYNRALDLAYFTPMYKIFDHIKKVTRSTDIKLPEESDNVFYGFDSTDYGYCSPGDVETCPTAHNQGQKGFSAAIGAATPLGQVLSPRNLGPRRLSP